MQVGQIILMQLTGVAGLAGWSLTFGCAKMHVAADSNPERRRHCTMQCLRLLGWPGREEASGREGLAHSAKRQPLNRKQGHSSTPSTMGGQLWLESVQAVLRPRAAGKCTAGLGSTPPTDVSAYFSPLAPRHQLFSSLFLPTHTQNPSPTQNPSQLRLPQTKLSLAGLLLY
jgi:hypothetical protein